MEKLDWYGLAGCIKDVTYIICFLFLRHEWSKFELEVPKMLRLKYMILVKRNCEKRLLTCTVPCISTDRTFCRHQHQIRRNMWPPYSHYVR